jgi:hypothetical protein
MFISRAWATSSSSTSAQPTKAAHVSRWPDNDTLRLARSLGRFSANGIIQSPSFISQAPLSDPTAQSEGRRDSPASGLGGRRRAGEAGPWPPKAPSAGRSPWRIGRVRSKLAHPAAGPAGGRCDRGRVSRRHAAAGKALYGGSQFCGIEAQHLAALARHTPRGGADSGRESD